MKGTELIYWSVIGLLMYGDGSEMEEGLGTGVFSDQLRMAYSYKLDRKCKVFLKAEISPREASRID